MHTNKTLKLAFILSILFFPKGALAMAEAANEDRFILDSFDSLADMKSRTGEIIKACDNDFKCFEAKVRKDNPDIKYVSYDNKINIAHQFSVQRTYKIIHKLITLIALNTVNGKIVDFDVNSGVR